MQVRNIIQTVANWGKKSLAASDNYKYGVENPRADWATAAVAAKDNYSSGVQTAIANDSFSKGVTKAGTDKWKKRATEVGPARWTTGITGGGAAYYAGVNPYLKVLTDLTLPARGPAGSAQNIERVRVIADALHAKKLAGGV